MKRLMIFLLAGALFLCSCSAKVKYEDAYTSAGEQKSFTVTVSNEMTVETDGQSTPYTETVRFSQGNGILSAERTADEEYTEYYYMDGCIYYVSDMGSYVWEADTAEYYSEFCYEKPMAYEFEECEEKDGVTAFTAELNGNDHKDMLLALNPSIADFDISEADFTRFVYSATVKDGKLASYTYDFALDAASGEEKAVITNVMTVTYEESADNVEMPEGYESFMSSGGNITDLSEEAFTQEVMLIIVEALYNADGTRKDDFDETYAEFVQMYGEDVMSTFIGGIEEYNASIGIGQ